MPRLMPLTLPCPTFMRLPLMEYWKLQRRPAPFSQPYGSTALSVMLVQQVLLLR